MTNDADPPARAPRAWWKEEDVSPLASEEPRARRGREEREGGRHPSKTVSNATPGARFLSPVSDSLHFTSLHAMRRDTGNYDKIAPPKSNILYRTRSVLYKVDQTTYRFFFLSCAFVSQQVHFFGRIPT